MSRFYAMGRFHPNEHDDTNGKKFVGTGKRILDDDNRLELKLPSLHKSGSALASTSSPLASKFPADPVYPFENGMVVGGQGEFLGFVTRNHEDPNSLANPQGTHGNPLP